MSAPKSQARFAQIRAFFRRLIPNPAETRPLAQFAVNSAKAAHFIRSAAAGVESVERRQNQRQLPREQWGLRNGNHHMDAAHTRPAVQHDTEVILEQLRRPIIAKDIVPTTGTTVEFTSGMPRLAPPASTRVNPRLTSLSNAVSSVSGLVRDKEEIEGRMFGTKKLVIDPMKLVGADLSHLTGNIKNLLTGAHPKLTKVARYYFGTSGKQIRPLLVLLVAQATSMTAMRGLDTVDHSIMDRQVSIDLEGDEVSRRYNRLIRPLAAGEDVDQNVHARLYQPSVNKEGLAILPSQRRLAEITEMVHTASLLHDDVVDKSVTRRGQPAIQKEFGNKLAVLAGDFILSRSSLLLARLRDPNVIEVISSVISDLVEGEFKQLENTSDVPEPFGSLQAATGAGQDGPTEETFRYYLEKTYLKTGSLIAKSCQAAAMLGDCPREIIEAAYIFGRNVGIAFQLVDDLLDFTGSESVFGKPVGADLNLGIATAPVLYAWQEFPELALPVHRKFSEPGDVRRTFELVHLSQGINKTKMLAFEYAQRAADALSLFPSSASRDALFNLTETIINRQK
ncbi:coq1 putative hexaprenyl diphosphate synthase [Spiromyces aspiralis]|uniref:Coq1 putative hexaprenyl diphosphate synthase n=1 Tax=Spiromyces aspiralis TaxID=68401 RepID=A0ACC1HW51_9FUNG|nr:coq1 putative hexaprenyl diphosphate synthase [Spiromyces aspiralis]